MKSVFLGLGEIPQVFIVYYLRKLKPRKVWETLLPSRKDLENIFWRPALSDLVERWIPATLVVEGTSYSLQYQKILELQKLKEKNILPPIPKDSWFCLVDLGPQTGSWVLSHGQEANNKNLRILVASQGNLSTFKALYPNPNKYGKIYSNYTYKGLLDPRLGFERTFILPKEEIVEYIVLKTNKNVAFLMDVSQDLPWSSEELSRVEKILSYVTDNFLKFSLLAGFILSSSDLDFHEFILSKVSPSNLYVILKEQLLTFIDPTAFEKYYRGDLTYESTHFRAFTYLIDRYSKSLPLELFENYTGAVSQEALAYLEEKGFNLPKTKEIA